MSTYEQYESLYDWSVLSFPVLLKDIHKFEIVNNESVNVYGCINYKCTISDEIDREDNNDDTEDESIDTSTESEILHDNEVCRELLEKLQCSSDEGDESAHEATHNAVGSNDEVRPTKERRYTIHPLKVANKIIQISDEDGNIIENRQVNLLLTEKAEISIIIPPLPTLTVLLDPNNMFLIVSATKLSALVPAITKYCDMSRRECNC